MGKENLLNEELGAEHTAGESVDENGPLRDNVNEWVEEVSGEVEETPTCSGEEEHEGQSDTESPEGEAESPGEFDLQEKGVEEDLSSRVLFLEEQLNIKSQQAEELIGLIQRLQADFENLRKRTIKEKDELKAAAAAGLLEKFLPIIDNFDRALSTDTSVQEGSFREGVEMIYRQMQKVLAEEGMRSIAAVGEQFDPNKHEAVMQVEDSSVEQNTIVEELQKGYMYHDRVIRPSMVKVASKQ